MRKVIAFVGNYGSGKTELSLNTAYKWADEGEKTILVDLDIVNPYFRSSEKREKLEKSGIEVIQPNFANTNIDVPSISPLVGASFKRADHNLILDVGGDPVGAKALGQFRHVFREQQGMLYFVINVFRPLTGTVENILTMLENVQSSCGMKADALINNSNIAELTTKENVKAGLEIIEQVSKITGQKIAFSSGTEQVLEGIDTDKFFITRQMELEI